MPLDAEDLMFGYLCDECNRQCDGNCTGEEEECTWCNRCGDCITCENCTCDSDPDSDW